MSVAALLAPRATCALCPEVRRRAAGSPDVWVCGDCGRRFHPPRVYRLDPDAPEIPRTPLGRAGNRASALSLTDDERELARVRMVLTDLRPDHPDPLVPLPPRAEVEAQAVRAGYNPAGEWGGIPRGLASPMAAVLARAELATRTGADVLAEVNRCGGYDTPTLRWLRCDASLAEGLNALFFSAGVALATVTQRASWAGDLTAKRDGANLVGRRLVRRAVATWEKVMAERGSR